MNRSEIFTTLLEKRPWTDYEWEKRTNITRATFGNNRKNNGQNVKSRTLELMAKATGFKLIQTNAKKGILPSSAEALFELIGLRFFRSDFFIVIKLVPLVIPVRPVIEA